MTVEFFMGVTRTEQCCPRCGTVLQSHRNLYGLPQPPDYP
jgi:ribosomal protein S27AE